MLTLQRDDSSAVLPGMFRLEVTAPDAQRPTIQLVEGTFALIGRNEGCACRLDHPAVGNRHAYLQAIYGRIYCVDLGSPAGTLWNDTPRIGGWLNPEDVIRIGPYRIRLIDMLGLGSRNEEISNAFNPLERYAGDAGPLPKVVLHVRGAGRHGHYAISRPITLVGSASSCKLHLADKSVSTIHSSLIWMPDGLHIVDLAGKGGSIVQGKPVRSSKLVEGDKLRIGKFLLRVHYPTEPEPQRRRPVISEEASLFEAEPDGVDADQAALSEDRAALEAEREKLTAHRQALDGRLQQLQTRETKLSEAQGRLAAEWDRLYADRAALTAQGEEFTRWHEHLANESRRQMEQDELLERQRQEMSTRAAELAEIRKTLKGEWTRLEAKAAEIKQRFTAERADLSELKESIERRKSEIAASDQSPEAEPDPNEDSPSAAPLGDFDILEATRHNKVFSTERSGDTLIMIPLGDTSDFHYGDVHTESNKVRRLLEGGLFRNLVVDLGSAPVFNAVTINVVVALSRIACNRGGKAVLCTASEKTRDVLQTMKLLELWPIFTSREEAIRALCESVGS